MVMGQRACLVLLLFVGGAPASAQVVVDLGTFGGHSTRAWAMNDHGQVVGGSDMGDSNASHAFSWTTETGMVDLGTLGGASSGATAVNNRGEVVGVSLTSTGVTHPFLWTRARGMIDLDPRPAVSSFASAINDAGVVAIAADLEAIRIEANPRFKPALSHLFRWTAATGFEDIGSIPGRLVPQIVAINRDGTIVGNTYQIQDNPWALPSHAFSWTPRDGVQDLGTLGGTWSLVTGLNDRGDIVGVSSSDPNASIDDQIAHVGHAFLWTSAAGMRDLGTLGGATSVARAVTPSGAVIGEADTAEGFPHAFVWTASGGMTDLGTLGGNVSTALAGNDRVIAGVSSGPDSVGRPFAWTATLGMVALPDLEPTSEPIAVGAVGLIAGNTAETDDAGTHAVVWRLPTTARTPIADAYVRAGRWAHTNFGASPTLQAKKGADADNTRRAYLKLDVHDVPAGAHVPLRLRARLSTATTTPSTLTVYAVDDRSWAEKTVTWNSRPALNEVVADVMVSSSHAEWFTVDLTHYVAAQRAIGRKTVAIALRVLAHSTASVIVDSREAGAHAPVLIVTPQ
jgi:probable HAF family extracellular repeat protein